jgi:hypothetical protein
MISIVQFRDKDGERILLETLTFEQPLDALPQIVKTELAFGGQITEASPIRVVVETWLYGSRDTCIVTGTREELHPLLVLAYHHTEGLAKHPEAITSGAVGSATRLGNTLAGSPDVVGLASPILLGRNRLKAALLLACGITDGSAIRVLTQHRLEDLVAAFHRQADGGCSFEQALAA